MRATFPVMTISKHGEGKRTSLGKSKRGKGVGRHVGTTLARRGRPVADRGYFLPGSGIEVGPLEHLTCLLLDLTEHAE